MNNQSSDISFELESLSLSVNYQRWVYETILPFLGDSILEVGAGIGNMSQWLPLRKNLIITEAESSYIDIIKKKIRNIQNPSVKVEHVDLSKSWLSNFTQYNLDTIVSFNVLEHIEDDAATFRDFINILKQSHSSKTKRIITFVPAHQFLYGSLDEVFGHYRRYDADSTKVKIKDIDPTVKVTTQYFNILGLFGWFVLGKVLKRKMIGLDSIRTFELLCPYIKKIDNFLHSKMKIPLGQSLLIIIEVG